MSEILDEELSASFVQPHKSFKGEQIAEYTEGSRLLMLQCKDKNDSSVYFVWAFLYLHLLIHKNKREAIKLAWDKDAFRERVLDWVVDKTDEDRDNATNIVSTIIEEAGKARVAVVRSGFEGQASGNE
jgi:hypothetical protein